MFNFILPIQQVLRPYDLDLQRVFFGDEFLWGVVNLNGDAIAQLATTYTAEEVAAYKRVMDCLSSAPGHHITALEATMAIQRTDASIKCTASKAEAILAEFLDDKWLHQLNDRKGPVVLGPKAVLELRTYLVEERLFSECTFCAGLIVNGSQMGCSGFTTGQCPVVLHEQCGRTLGACPTCKAPLSS